MSNETEAPKMVDKMEQKVTILSSIGYDWGRRNSCPWTTFFAFPTIKMNMLERVEPILPRGPIRTYLPISLIIIFLLELEPSDFMIFSILLAAVFYQI